MRCNNNILKFLSILLVLSISTALLCNTAYAVDKAYKVETLFNIGTKFDDNVAQVDDILYYHNGRNIYRLNMITKDNSVYVEDLLSKSVTYDNETWNIKSIGNLYYDRFREEVYVRTYIERYDVIQEKNISADFYMNVKTLKGYNVSLVTTVTEKMYGGYGTNEYTSYHGIGPLIETDLNGDLIFQRTSIDYAYSSGGTVYTTSTKDPGIARVFYPDYYGYRDYEGGKNKPYKFTEKGMKNVKVTYYSEETEERLYGNVFGAQYINGTIYMLSDIGIMSENYTGDDDVILKKRNAALGAGENGFCIITDKNVIWTDVNGKPTKSCAFNEVLLTDGDELTNKKANKLYMASDNSIIFYDNVTCSLRKIDINSANIPVNSIALNKSTLSLVEGSSETLTATVLPANATNKDVTWKSSAPGVASVSNGVVTALKAGTAVITATTADGGFTASCTFTVTAKPVDDNAPKIKINDVKAKPGNEVDVTIELENNTGFASMGIEVGYNSDIMTLTKVTSNSGVGGTFTPAQAYTVNPFNMGWDSAANITYNGNLATLTFKIADNAADGIYPITLDYYKGRNGNYVDGEDVNYDENDNAVGFVYISGSVIVASYIPGDINGDEKVNNKDATFLLRYLAGWSVDGINTDALDTDGSGTVNNKDATLLLRYLAGWSVTLH